jgi:hypothetical protein
MSDTLQIFHVALAFLNSKTQCCANGRALALSPDACGLNTPTPQRAAGAMANLARLRYAGTASHASTTFAQG